MMITHCW